MLQRANTQVGSLFGCLQRQNIFDLWARLLDTWARLSHGLRVEAPRISACNTIKVQVWGVAKAEDVRSTRASAFLLFGRWFCAASGMKKAPQNLRGFS
jgi:hypothetical protein